MSDHPIPFSASMVRALLAGRKTQMRQILKPQPPEWATVCSAIFPPQGLFQWSEDEHDPPRRLRRWPEDHALRVRFGKGDRLYVREAWAEVGSMDPGLFITRADYPACVPRHYENVPPADEVKWRPGIHMPRARSRLTLTVTDVRVQRLQEISEADAIAEGASSWPNCYGFEDRDDGWCMDWTRVGQASKWASDGKALHERDVCLATARYAFANFFDAINGDGSWNANPWVVAVTYTVVQRNIDR